jgi:hypothetical protein
VRTCRHKHASCNMFSNTNRGYVSSFHSFERGLKDTFAGIYKCDV